MLLDISRLFLEFGFSIFLSFYIFFRGPGRMSDFFGTQRSARATCHHIGFAGQRSAGEIGQDRSWHGTWRNHCRLSWFRCIPLIIILFLPFFFAFFVVFFFIFFLLLLPLLLSLCWTKHKFCHHKTKNLSSSLLLLRANGSMLKQFMFFLSCRLMTNCSFRLLWQPLCIPWIKWPNPQMRWKVQILISTNSFGRSRSRSRSPSSEHHTSNIEIARRP